jgi:hypothetical protein
MGWRVALLLCAVACWNGAEAQSVVCGNECLNATGISWVVHSPTSITYIFVKIGPMVCDLSFFAFALPECAGVTDVQRVCDGDVGDGAPFGACGASDLFKVELGGHCNYTLTFNVSVVYNFGTMVLKGGGGPTASCTNCTDVLLPADCAGECPPPETPGSFGACCVNETCLNCDCSLCEAFGGDFFAAENCTEEEHQCPDVHAFLLSNITCDEARASDIPTGLPLLDTCTNTNDTCCVEGGSFNTASEEGCDFVGGVLVGSEETCPEADPSPTSTAGVPAPEPPAPAAPAPATPITALQISFLTIFVVVALGAFFFVALNPANTTRVGRRRRRSTRHRYR